MSYREGQKKEKKANHLLIMIFGHFTRIKLSTVLLLQLLLLQESWKELFLLHLAQWSIPWDLSLLFNSSKARERLPPDDPVVNNEIKAIQEILARFRQLSPDGSECGCMKAVILFTPGTYSFSFSLQIFY